MRFRDDIERTIYATAYATRLAILRDVEPPSTFRAKYQDGIAMVAAWGQERALMAIEFAEQAVVSHRDARTT